MPFIQFKRYKGILGTESSLEYANTLCQPASRSTEYTQSNKLSKISDRKENITVIQRWPGEPLNLSRLKNIDNKSDA